MFKKFVLYPIYVVLTLAIVGVGAFYLSPLPYIPINRFLSSSQYISGHVTGSVLSGVRITNLKIKGVQEGEISFKEISFHYSGLSYLLRDQLIITDITWDGVRANLPHGNLTNWSILQREFENRLYLLPPVPKKSVTLVQLNNVSFRNIDITLGKSEVPSASPSALMFPLMMMSSRLLGQGTTPGFTPGVMPPPPTAAKPKPKNKIESFRLKSFEISNARLESYPSKRASFMKRMKIENLVIEKSKFDLGRLDIQSDGFGLTVTKSPQSGNDWESLIVDIEGALKQGENENQKKDISFSGQLANKQLDLSAFDGKVTLHSGQSPGSLMPTMELKATGVNLPDYFFDIAPITNINFSYRPGVLFSKQIPTPVTFDVGAGHFQGTLNSRIPMRIKNVDLEILVAQLTKIRDLSAALLWDAAIPGKIRIKLSQNPPRLPPRYLLSSVWYGKNFMTLKPTEMAFLQTLAVYFGMDPKEFEVVAKKQSKPRKTRRKR